MLRRVGSIAANLRMISNIAARGLTTNRKNRLKMLTSRTRSSALRLVKDGAGGQALDHNQPAQKEQNGYPEYPLIK